MAIEKRIPQGFFAEFLNEGVYYLKEEDIKKQAEPVQNEPVIANPKPMLKLNGKPDADTLLLLNYPGQIEIPAADKEYLAKILAAVKLSFNAVAWLNTSGNEISEGELESSPAKNIFAFGIHYGILPHEIKHDELSQKNGRYYYATEAVASLKENPSGRRLFWEALQKIFNI